MSDENNDYIEIDLDDFETIGAPNQSKQPKPLEPIKCLPAELQKAASKLPIGQQHTLLELENEGSGHNNSLLKNASIMYKMGVDLHDAHKHLCDTYSPARNDYETAPLRAINRIWEVEGDLTKLIDSDSESRPKKNDSMLLRFRRMTSQELILASPSARDLKPIDILKNLFDEDSIINVQRTAYESGTMFNVSQIEADLIVSSTSINEFKFLNPSIFKKKEGIENTRNHNKITTRCNDNVKRRDFMVLEMDTDDESECERFSGFAFALSQYAPLKMAVDTGKKSIHFWFDASDIKPKVRSSFFALACLHGADPRLAVKSQIARMPNVSSAKEGRGAQTLLYFDENGDNFPDGKKWDLKGFEDYLNKSRQLECYYKPGGGGGTYYTKDDRNKWRGLDKGSFKIHLNALGFRSEKMEGETVAPADHVVMDIQNTKTIESVFGHMSGRHAGFYEENGQRFLVTNSPVFIKPRKGQWRTIKRFLKGMFVTDKQFKIFLGWLSASIKDLRNDGKRIGRFTQMQMLHICGPPNCGKTLLLEHILKNALSGRIAKCDSYFKVNATSFNSDIFGADLLFLDDSPVFSSNYRFRQEMSEKMKSAIVGGTARMERKGVDAIAARPWWRVIRFLNNDVQHLATLPLQEDGVDDKWSLLEVQALGDHWPESELPGWAEVTMKGFQDDMPAFIHYLTEEHIIAPEEQDTRGRYGVQTYKNESLLQSIAEGSPEQYLQHRWDNDCKLAMFGDVWNESVELKPWRGSSGALYDLMAITGNRIQQQRFQKICPNEKILLAQLRQIEKDNTNVNYSLRCDDIPNKQNGSEYWQIKPTTITNSPMIDGGKSDINEDLLDFM
ncbi:DUF5906 domain-containing protein [Akkermansiaceae bacterium]|nr:DUF5906 domain-containing protein [Akkermansiaceae bacterium]